MATRRRAATKPEVVEDDAFEEIAEDADDLDELIEEEPIEDAPAPKTKRGRPAKVKAEASDKRTRAASNADGASETGGDAFNTAWLAEHVTEVTGIAVDSRSLRMLLRKMAAAGTLAREVGVDRARYVFPKGANDVTVKSVVKAVKGGELVSAKREGLDKVKSSDTPKRARSAKVEEAPVDEVAAKRTTRTRAAKTAAPAKAAPSAGRRRRAAPAE